MRTARASERLDRMPSMKDLGVSSWKVGQTCWVTERSRLRGTPIRVTVSSVHRLLIGIGGRRWRLDAEVYRTRADCERVAAHKQLRAATLLLKKAQYWLPKSVSSD